MNRISIFKDFFTTKQPYYLSLQAVVERIRDGKAKSQVEQIRTQADPKEADRLKKLLPCICFSGRFTERLDTCLPTHSGLMVLDFDHKPTKYYPVADPKAWQDRHPGTQLNENPTHAGQYALLINDPAAFRDSMAQYPFVAIAFVSPSGKGLKVVVNVPPIKSQHRGHYAAILRFFEVLDTTSQNESRICFESYDPDIYVNEEEVLFTDYIAPQDPKVTPPPVGEKATKTDYGKLNLCAAMIRNAADGAKHETLLKAAKLAGGYIASGIVDEVAAIRMLEAEIEAKANVDDIKGAFKTIRDGIEYGKRVPIYEQTPEEQPIPKSETRNGVVYLADVWEQMDYTFNNGKARGETTHFPDLDEHFTWKRGDFTVVSGRPGSGKSEWVLQLMLIKSIKDKWKWGIFSPESFPAGEFYDTLIHALVGRSTDPAYKDQMSLENYEEAANFIQQHFFYVYPDTTHTIEDVESNFLHLHKTQTLDGVLIDPFNQLEQDFSLRDDQYLQKFITNRKRFALDNQLNYMTIVHPKAMSKNADGEYNAVDAYDLANGAMWINKTDNFISVYRPNQSTHPKDTSVEILVKKIKKQKLVGTPGSVFWNFERNSNRYFSSGFSPLQTINAQSTLAF